MCVSSAVFLGTCLIISFACVSHLMCAKGLSALHHQGLRMPTSDQAQQHGSSIVAKINLKLDQKHILLSTFVYCSDE